MTYLSDATHVPARMAASRNTIRFFIGYLNMKTSYQCRNILASHVSLMDLHHFARVPFRLPGEARRGCRREGEGAWVALAKPFPRRRARERGRAHGRRCPGA